MSDSSQSDKIGRTTVTLPESLLRIAQEHSRREFMTFSGLLEKALRNQLKSDGLFSEDAVAAELQHVRELIGTRGVEAVKAKLDELSNETVLTEGGQR